VLRTPVQPGALQVLDRIRHIDRNIPCQHRPVVQWFAVALGTSVRAWIPQRATTSGTSNPSSPVHDDGPVFTDTSPYGKLHPQTATGTDLAQGARTC